MIKYNTHISFFSQTYRSISECKAIPRELIGWI